MKPGKEVIGLAAAAALLMVVNLKASDPVGVYGIVERERIRFRRRRIAAPA